MSNPDDLMTRDWKETFRVEWYDCVNDLKKYSQYKGIDLDKYKFVDNLHLDRQLHLKKRTRSGV